MSGEMENPLMIGKTAKPRCFRNLDIRKLPVVWRSKKGMDDVTDHGRMVKDFQLQNENEKPPCFVVLG